MYKTMKGVYLSLSLYIYIYIYHTTDKYMYKSYFRFPLKYTRKGAGRRGAALRLEGPSFLWSEARTK